MLLSVSFRILLCSTPAFAKPAITGEVFARPECATVGATQQVPNGVTRALQRPHFALQPSFCCNLARRLQPGARVQRFMALRTKTVPDSWRSYAPFAYANSRESKHFPILAAPSLLVHHYTNVAKPEMPNILKNLNRQAPDKPRSSRIFPRSLFQTLLNKSSSRLSDKTRQFDFSTDCKQSSQLGSF